MLESPSGMYYRVWQSDIFDCHKYILLCESAYTCMCAHTHVRAHTHTQNAPG